MPLVHIGVYFCLHDTCLDNLHRDDGLGLAPCCPSMSVHVPEGVAAAAALTTGKIEDLDFGQVRTDPACSLGCQLTERLAQMQLSGMFSCQTPQVPGHFKLLEAACGK